MKIISKIILCALLAPMVMLSSCNEDAPDNPQITTFMAFVTLTELNEKSCVFTTQEKDDSELVTYTCEQTLDKQVFKTGERYLISFTNESNERFKSGPIVFHGYQPIVSEDAQIKAHSLIGSYMVDPINVALVERSGTYINLQATAPAMQNIKFGIYIDEATAENAYPEAYVIYKSDNAAASDKLFYGSFDLTPVWKKTTCKGINLHFNTSDGLKTEKFSKSVSGFEPAV